MTGIAATLKFDVIGLDDIEEESDGKSSTDSSDDQEAEEDNKSESSG